MNQLLRTLIYSTLGVCGYTQVLATDVTEVRPLPDSIDVALVIDNSQSMQPVFKGLAAGISHLVGSLGQSLAAKDGLPPIMELITFDEVVTSRGATRDLKVLLEKVNAVTLAEDLKCATASTEAIMAAAQNLKAGGMMVLATHSAPTEGTNLNGLKDLLASKKIRLNVLLAGECQ